MNEINFYLMVGILHLTLLAASITALFLVFPPAAQAEEIIYTGDKKQLQEIPSWFADDSSYAIFPGTTGLTLFSGNKVTIDYDPTAQGIADPEFVFGGLGKGRNAGNNEVVLRNEVTIHGGVIDYSVYGGFSENGDVTGNSVTINGGSVGRIVYGGYSRDGDANGNVVTISDGSVSRIVYGGYSNKSGSDSHDGDAKGNSVTISGGYVGDGVIGGSSDRGEATGNIVTISGSPDLVGAFVLGGLTNLASNDSFTGNTLNLKNSGILVWGAGYFEYYNFYLPDSLIIGEAMLHVTDDMKMKLAGTTVEIFLQGGTKLRKGDKIALIKSATGIRNAPKNKSCKTQQGGLLYEFSIYIDKNNLWAEVTKVSNAAK